MNPLRVLVACEYSGTVRDAFLALGHDATSCDLLASDTPGPHYRGDVRDILGDGWDIMVAHPPCTNLAVSGARHFAAKAARSVLPMAGLPSWWDDSQGSSLDFVQELMTAPIERIAVENPVSIISSAIRKPDQIVQPWMFGHPEPKTTCLWLKNLPPLVETDNVRDQITTASRNHIHNISPGGENGVSRWRIRSATFPGLASAMAGQWGSLAPVGMLGEAS